MLTIKKVPPLAAFKVLLYDIQIEFFSKGSRKKKVILVMAGPLRSNPPPPSSLMAVETLERWKKRFKKKFVFLNGPALYPTPLLMARPLREELFFCGFP